MISWKKLFLLILIPLLILLLILSSTYLQNIFQSVNEYIASYRYYRAIYVFISGFILASSGCYLQSVLRNPLVDHYILGIGSGALFASYLAILLHGYSIAVVTVFAVFGGLLALSLVVLIAERISGSDVAYVLSGISVTSLFSGLSIFLSYYVIIRYPYASLMLTGSFTLARPGLLPSLLLPFILVVMGYILFAKKINALILGDEYSAQLGVNPRTTRIYMALISGISSSIVVALFGLIGFIGLVAPHIARFLTKTSDNRIVVPLASSIGSLLLYSTDMFSRIIAAPVMGEIPAGAIVSLIGAPFFLLLIASRLRGRVV